MPGRFLKTGDDIGSELEGGGGVVDGPAPTSDQTPDKASKKKN